MRKVTKTKKEIYNYIIDCLNGFLKDPPDSDYQKGYLAGIFELKKFLTS